jgi:two-component system, chemotaxis family, chemotaxis protein CheY
VSTHESLPAYRDIVRPGPEVRAILVVDDALTIRQHARLLLEAHGYRVVEAKNGRDGLQAVQKERFDLIIVDVNMPVMSGLQMVAEVRKLAEYRRTPIFVLTTESSQETVLEGKAAGATAWVVKPFKVDILIPAIRRVLEP